MAFRVGGLPWPGRSGRPPLPLLSLSLFVPFVPFVPFLGSLHGLFDGVRQLAHGDNLAVPASGGEGGVYISRTAATSGRNHSSTSVGDRGSGGSICRAAGDRAANREPDHPATDGAGRGARPAGQGARSLPVPVAARGAARATGPASGRRGRSRACSTIARSHVAADGGERAGDASRLRDGRPAGPDLLRPLRAAGRDRDLRRPLPRRQQRRARPGARADACLRRPEDPRIPVRLRRAGRQLRSPAAAAPARDGRVDSPAGG